MISTPYIDSTGHLTIRKGDTLALTLTYTDSDGNAIDLTGYSANFQVRNTSLASLLLEASTDGDSPGIALGDADGTIEVTVDADDTAGVGVASGVYGLTLTSGDGVTTTILYGDVTILPAVVSI
jgi:hypothetical protein